MAIPPIEVAVWQILGNYHLDFYGKKSKVEKGNNIHI